MTEVKSEMKVVKENTKDEATSEIPKEQKKEKEVPQIVPFNTPEERLSALQEIDILSRLINTTFYSPKFDQGNNGKQQPKITGSTQLNYFSGQQMQIWGQKIIDLSNRL